MASDKEIEDGAKVIAKDLALPGGGRKKLARVVEDHLDWFNAAEARGLTWSDMTRMLFAAGAKGRGGRPISIGTLSSAVWRKRKNAEAPMPVARPRAKTRATRTQQGRRKRTGDSNVLTVDRQPTAAIADKIAKISVKPRTTEEAVSPAKQDSSTKVRKSPRIDPTSKSDTLAFMKRAAAIRRSRND
jgi:hypothetical protein